MEYFVTAVITVCYVLIVAIIIRSLMSWFAVDSKNILMNILHTITEPILGPLRRILPRLETIDISPMVAIILLYVIVWLLRAHAM
ncbi:MAG: YggT family protein [Dehalococcoidia bacterium]|nr:YggT family protein [Dehalococcoidia bacterium]